ncbi:hypothetical protein Ancab_020513 [Ancistrocladus abbreviatus]
MLIESMLESQDANKMLESLLLQVCWSYRYVIADANKCYIYAYGSRFVWVSVPCHCCCKSNYKYDSSTTLQSQLLHLTFEADQMALNFLSSLTSFRSSMHMVVGLLKILSMLESQDANIRIHAVKVVANLAAEGCNTYF